MSVSDRLAKADSESKTTSQGDMGVYCCGCLISPSSPIDGPSSPRPLTPSRTPYLELSIRQLSSSRALSQLPMERKDEHLKLQSRTPEAACPHCHCFIDRISQSQLCSEGSHDVRVH